MNLNIIAKLTAHRRKQAETELRTWGSFVSDVASGKMTDLDAIVAGLQEHGKTEKDLDAAIQRIQTRRVDVKLVQAGRKAESEYPRLVAQQAEAEQELQRLIEAHEKKYSGLDEKILRARSAMSDGDSAQRRLREGVSSATKAKLFDSMDSELADLQQQRADILQAIKNKERWIQTVEGRDEQAASGDRQRLAGAKAELKSLQAESAEIAEKLGTAQDRRNKAEDLLLDPELI